MAEPQGHDQRINSAIARAAARRGYQQEAITTRTPLDDLLAKEEGEDAQAQRREALSLVLLYFFADGPHPGCVLRRVYAVTKAVKPKLCLDMTLEELALMFGETKAAQQWRIDKIFNDYQRLRGVKGFKAAFQKSDEARAAYSRAQRGNHNRRGNHKAA
jgi:hypothetical protein